MRLFIERLRVGCQALQAVGAELIVAIERVGEQLVLSKELLALGAGVAGDGHAATSQIALQSSSISQSAIFDTGADCAAESE